MSNMSQRIPTRGPQFQQQDKAENRQRVAVYVDGNSVSYEGTLTSGPDVICNFFNDVTQGSLYQARRAHYGYIINDGEGDFQVSWTFDGTNYGGIHTLKQNEKISFDGFTVQTVKLHWTIADADYRLLLM